MPAAVSDNPYESARLRDEYLLFHYGRPEEILPYPGGPAGALGFPARAVRECLDQAALPPGARALDVGCAVGRTSFELARLGCAEVVGVDRSENFIRAADALRADGRLAYRRADEGRLFTELVAEVPTDADRGRTRFQVGDAGALDVAALGKFDVVVGLNLLCRLPAPRRFLAALPALVKPGGQLLLATPCSWLEEYTAPDQWLGGFVDREGNPVRTLDTLRAILAPDFDLLHVRDLPFLIREHARKFQWSVSQASVWRRK